MPAMRDVFWNRLFEKAKEDRNIVVLSADFSAPALDRFRVELPAQYIRLGIAEQNMLLMSSGLALEGKRPFCYAIAPFLTMRCFEQLRLFAAAANLPVTLVGVGSGFAYSDSGCTHHALEDISILRSLPHMKIFQPCDNAAAGQMTDMILNQNGPVYLRLDRYGEDELGPDLEHLESGLREIRPVQQVTLLVSGYMVKSALAAAKRLHEGGIEVGILDACVIPFDRSRFSRLMKSVETLVVWEEHALPGGLGSYVLECVSDWDLPVNVHRFGLDTRAGYIEEYSSREALHRAYHIDVDTIVSFIMREGEI